MCRVKKGGVGFEEAECFQKVSTQALSHGTVHVPTDMPPAYLPRRYWALTIYIYVPAVLICDVKDIIATHPCTQRELMKKK
jgi:hypothetical protein